MKNKTIFPLLILFAAISTTFFLLKTSLESAGLKTNILHGANIFFLLVSLLVAVMQQSSLNNSNPNAFVRAVMGGVMIKMFGTIAAVVFYYLLSGKDFSEKTVFVSLFIYLVYLGVEVFFMSKINKPKNGL